MAKTSKKDQPIAKQVPDEKEAAVTKEDVSPASITLNAAEAEPNQPIDVKEAGTGISERLEAEPSRRRCP